MLFNQELINNVLSSSFCLNFEKLFVYMYFSLLYNIIFYPSNNISHVDSHVSFMQAVDLYVLLSSFLPKGGEIISVSVYPSEFGLKRMEEEAVHGPVGLFDDDKDKNASDDEHEEIDIEKLRAYELSRLRQVILNSILHLLNFSRRLYTFYNY